MTQFQRHDMGITCVWYGALFVIFFLATAARGQSTNDNLLINGTFSDDNGQAIAKGWGDNSGWADLAADFSLIQENNGALQAQKIQCTKFVSGAVQFVQQGVTIKKDHAYRLTVRMKGDVESPIEILLRKKGKPYTTYISRAFKVSKDWQEFSFVGIAPVDDSNSYFMIRFIDTGTLYLAECGLEEVTVTPQVPPPTNDNIIANGSFEVGLDRWGVMLREKGSPSMAMMVQFVNSKPQIVSSKAAEGQKYLRVDLPENSRVKITSSYFQAVAGNTYTLSCWLASDQPRNIRVGLGSGYFQADQQVIKSFTVSAEWQKISFQIPLANVPDNLYYFILEASDKGVIRLDGVSLRPEGIADYKPSKNVEVSFARQDQNTIFYVYDDVKVKLNAVNHTDTIAKLDINYFDFWDRKHLLNTAEIVGGQDIELWVTLPSNNTGYYRLSAVSSTGSVIQDKSELAIAVIPRPASSPGSASPFGVHVRFNEEMLEYAKMLGVRWLRMHPPNGTKWFIVEKEKGKFIYNDEPIRLAKEKGFNILGMLATTPRWASSAPADAISESVGSFRSYPPNEMKDWRNYVFQTVSHYKGMIDHWEVWNEPDSGNFLKISGMQLFPDKKAKIYTELLKEAFITAKKANPAAVIIGGGANHLPLTNWTKKIMQKGAGEYLDILAYHYYTDGRPGDALPTPTGFHIDELYDLIGKYGGQSIKAIWETESGIMYPETSYTNINEVSPLYAVAGADGALYLVRNYIHLLSHGVAKWFYYHMFVSRQCDRREGTGFFEWDASPRPLAVAYSILSNAIGDCKFSHNIQTENDVSGSVFANTNKKVTVLWQNKLTPEMLVFFPIKISGNIQITDIMGNRILPIKKNGAYGVPVRQYPIYIAEEVSATGSGTPKKIPLDRVHEFKNNQ